MNIDKIAAGLLLMGGAISIREARRMAGLPDLTEKQKRSRQKMMDWCERTGVPMKQTCADAFDWDAWWTDPYIDEEQE